MNMLLHLRFLPMLKTSLTRFFQRVFDRAENVSVILGIREVFKTLAIKAVRIYFPARTFKVHLFDDYFRKGIISKQELLEEMKRVQAKMIKTKE